METDHADNDTGQYLEVNCTFRPGSRRSFAGPMEISSVAQSAQRLIVPGLLSATLPFPIHNGPDCDLF